MLLGLYIFVDDDFDTPIHAEGSPDEIEEAAWSTACECVSDALDGEGPARGAQEAGELVLAWRTQRKVGLSFVGFATNVSTADLNEYLRKVQRRYEDEVENLREPDRAGVADVIVDVIPPWD